MPFLNPGTQEAERGRSLRSRPAGATGRPQDSEGRENKNE